MGRQIRLQSDGPGNTRRILQKAVAMWSSCRGYGDVLPRFVTSGPAFRVVHVRFLRSSPSGVCGQFSSDTILLYASAHDRRGRRVPCDRLANNLAHELGHVLGLLDAPTDPACGHVIMAQDDLRLARRVDARECTAAATRWLADDAGRAADAPRR